MPNTHLLAAICDRAADKRDIDCAVGAGRQRVKAFVKYDEASGKEDGGGLDRRRADRPAEGRTDGQTDGQDGLQRLFDSARSRFLRSRRLSRQGCGGGGDNADVLVSSHGDDAWR